MFNEKFFEVLKYDGVVSIVTWGNEEPSITNTWNSYLQIKDENRILIP
ncbi:MAG: FMN-binding protein, partial [Pseudoleptotrichia goodfellowii]|nr:FMN-binding protein [Pseudoleptotrichia goodfellowii]